MTLLISSDEDAIEKLRRKIKNDKLDGSICALFRNIGSEACARPWHSYNDKRLNGAVCVERWSHSFPNVKLLCSEERHFIPLDECLPEWSKWLDYRENNGKEDHSAELIICEGDPYDVIQGGKDVLKLFDQIRIEGPCSRINDGDFLDCQLRQHGFVRCNDVQGMQWLRDEQLTLIADMRRQISELSANKIELHAKYSSLQDHYAVLQQEITCLEQVVQIKSNEILEHAETVKHTRAEHSNLINKLEGIQAANIKITDERDKLRNDLENLKAESSQLALERDQSSEKAIRLQAHIATLEQSIQEKDEVNNTLSAELLNRCLSADEIEAQLAKANLRVIGLEENQESLKVTNQNLINDNKSISLKLNSVTNDLISLKESYDLLDSELESARLDLIASTESVSKLGTEIERLHSVIHTLRQDKVNMITTQQGLASANADLQQANSDLSLSVAELKRQLSSIESHAHSLSAANQELADKLLLETAKSKDLSTVATESTHRIGSLEEDNYKLIAEIEILRTRYGHVHAMLKEALGDDVIIPSDVDAIFFLTEQLVNHRLQLSCERDQLSNQLDISNCERDNALAELDITKNTLDQKVNSEDKLRAEVLRLHAVITELREKIEDLLAQRTGLTSQLEDLQTIQSKLQTEISTLGSQSAKLSCELKEARSLLHIEQVHSSELGLAAADFMSMTKATDAHLNYIQQLLSHVIKDQCYSPSHEAGIVSNEA